MLVGFLVVEAADVPAHIPHRAKRGCRSRLPAFRSPAPRRHTCPFLPSGSKAMLVAMFVCGFTRIPWIVDRVAPRDIHGDDAIAANFVVVAMKDLAESLWVERCVWVRREVPGGRELRSPLSALWSALASLTGLPSPRIVDEPDDRVEVVQVLVLGLEREAVLRGRAEMNGSISFGFSAMSPFRKAPDYGITPLEVELRR